MPERPPRGRTTLIALSVAIACGALVPTSFVLSQFPGTLKAGERVQCGIVFGAGVHSSGTPSPALQRRMQRAAALMSGGIITQLILTGGQGEGNVAEADVMRVLGLRLGIDPDAVHLERASTSTWEALELSRPLLGACTGSIIAVSDRTHLARILLTSWMQELDVTTAPAMRAPLSQEIRQVVRESIALPYYLTAYGRKGGGEIGRK